MQWLQSLERSWAVNNPDISNSIPVVPSNGGPVGRDNAKELCAVYDDHAARGGAELGEFIIMMPYTSKNHSEIQLRLSTIGSEYVCEASHSRSVTAEEGGINARAHVPMGEWVLQS